MGRDPTSTAGDPALFQRDSKIIVMALDRLLEYRKLVVVGIDGHSGAGKTELAAALQRANQGVQVVHGDMFYKPADARAHRPSRFLPAGHEFELDRLEREVLARLVPSGSVQYVPRDFSTGALLEPTSIRPEGIVVIEGLYVMTKRLRPYYDYSVWIECPQDLCLERVLSRSGSRAMLEKYTKVWFPQEARYIREHAPAKAASRVVHSG